jgi:hypothetical protein
MLPTLVVVLGLGAGTALAQTGRAAISSTGGLGDVDWNDGYYRYYLSTDDDPATNDDRCVRFIVTTPGSVTVSGVVNVDGKPGGDGTRGVRRSDVSAPALERSRPTRQA